MVGELPCIDTPEQINVHLQSWAQTDLNAEIIPVLVCYKCFADSFMDKICTSLLFTLHWLPDAVQLIKVLRKSFFEFENSHTPKQIFLFFFISFLFELLSSLVSGTCTCWNYMQQLPPAALPSASTWHERYIFINYVYFSIVQPPVALTSHTSTMIPRNRISQTTTLKTLMWSQIFEIVTSSRNPKTPLKTKMVLLLADRGFLAGRSEIYLLQ